MEIRVRARTIRGASAIRQHMKESENLSWKVKKLMQLFGYEQKIGAIDGNLELIFESKKTKNKYLLLSFQDEIINAMQKNGAKNKIDYEIVLNDDPIPPRIKKEKG